ncbi:hypothetical protein CH298_02645 [Rhodococcoides fascians]|uniref:hypothetical protein n=1 Tax=Rhodococcoides fascians TaxID=1828 RepID=UPI000B9AAC64|nr:hypothetical protein [Rhodococcus fascians]OZE92451.1 hypothetical protein CH303_02645 [Rhodococcus fascians]OZF23084.1 hypothetical protein CH298_02645 [Rhodococcus fascians]OZF24798.1 hypothetical protein CH297_02645 [Rhodococcus fascians]OZF72393.1 hypothetical protein CH308_02650 [Rhodococcus fascians]OZF73691.1 hypothetical protein CH307_02645 [Rhodococcus fascians]
MSATSPRKKSTPTTPPKALDDFTFTTEDGTKLVLPPFKSVKPGVMRKIRKLDQADQFFTILETVLANRRQAEIDEVRENVIAAREAAGESDVEVTDREVEKQMEPDPTLDIIDDMESEEFQDFQRAWFEHSGVDLGE